MLLAIDIGNTNIVCALYEDGVCDQAKSIWRFPTAEGRTLEGYRERFSWAGILTMPEPLAGIMVASVVPPVDLVLAEFCRAYLKCDPVFVDHQNIPIVIKLDHPEQAGADRLVNGYAAQKAGIKPAVIVDFGTATTFDVVDGDGAFCGGLIAPGVHLSQKALSAAAAKLPEVAIEKPGRVVGRNTVEAMQSGLYWGYVGMVEGCLARIEAELGAAPFVLATGGLADLFAADIPAVKKVDKDLTLNGLAWLYAEINQ